MTDKLRSPKLVVNVVSEIKMGCASAYFKFISSKTY